MRIAFTVHKLPPESLGGTEIYTRSLARVLAETGHEIVIFAPSATVDTYTRIGESDGVTRVLTPLSPQRAHENALAQFWHTFRDGGMEADFVRFLADFQPDVVHFQHVQGVSVRMIDLAEGLPRVATLHDYWYFCANSQMIRPDESTCAGPSWGCHNCVDCATARADLHYLRKIRPITALPLAYRNQTLARAARQLDRMIAPSAFLRAQYVQQGFPAERIVVMENGLDIGRLGNLAAPVRTSATSRRPLRFGFLGSLAWQKGVHVAIEAFNRIDPAAAALDIYGSGSAFPEYAANVHAAVRNPSIVIHPPIAHNEIGAVLRGLDVLIVPSLWYENSPLVIQEAFATRVPVIASRLGALEEKVTPGLSGWLFNPGDSQDLARVIGDILADPAQIDALSATLPVPSTMHDQAQSLIALYESLRHSA